MKKRIEFYIDQQLVDVRVWDIAPHPGMIIDLIETETGVSRTVLVDQVVVTGDHENCKLMLACTDFTEYWKKHLERMAASKGKSENTVDSQEDH